MTKQRSGWIDCIIGLVLAAAAFVVYRYTLSDGLYPGMSADLAVQQMGLLPEWRPNHPLWGWLMKSLGTVPGYGHVARMNLSSAVCGALTLWVFYELMVQGVLYAINVVKGNRVRALVAARLAGIVATVSLAFSAPFWIVSNRALPHGFDVLLLLVALVLFVAYARFGSRRLAFVFALFYGLSTVESSTLVLFAPLLGTGILYSMWRHDDLNGPNVALLVFSALLGLSLYFLVAWRFFGTDGYVLRDYEGFLQVLVFMWRDQFFEITRSLPRVGWLIVLCMTVIPWGTALVVARRALNDERDWAFYVLHAVMTCLVWGVFLNLDFAPWAMMRGRISVTPYLLAAAVAGYLSAYWFLLPFSWWAESEKRGLRVVRPVIGAVLAVLCMLPTAVAPWRNFREADARGAGLVRRFAEDILDCIDGRTWLLTSGGMDNQLLLAAANRSLGIRVINLEEAGSGVYARYISQFFDDPSLQNLALIGVLPLLQEWFDDPAVADTVAILSATDLWIGAGYILVPNKLLYFGAREQGNVDCQSLFRSHETFWRDTWITGVEGTAYRGILARYAEYARRHTGRVANNLGVLCEDAGNLSLAEASYRHAREIEPQNVSALMNLVGMARRGYTMPDEADMTQQLAEVSESEAQRQGLWALSAYHGYVRSPRTFAELGWTWAFTGRPRMAAGSLRRALSLMPGSTHGQARTELANLYLLGGDMTESEALLDDILDSDPTNSSALLAKSRLLALQGALANARSVAQAAEKAGASTRDVSYVMALTDLLAGELDRAEQTLESLATRFPTWLQVWTMLAEIALRREDDVQLRTCIRRISELPRGEFAALILRGRQALMTADWGHAAESFERALILEPKNPALLEQVLRLDVLQAQLNDATSHARRLLQVDSGNAVANHIMGVSLANTRDFGKAEVFLRRSVKANPLPAVQNDLAWVLSELGQHVEAEAWVRRALEQDSELVSAWDTLGVILMRTERFVEAEEALERALSLSGGSPSVLLHLAELQIKQNRTARAVELLDKLAEHRASLSLENVERMDELRRQAAALR
jgi:protein O-GlcNAc transferase